MEELGIYTDPDYWEPDYPEPTMADMTAEELLEQLDIIDQLRAAADATRLELLAHYQQLRARDGKWAVRSTPHEVALALHIGRGHAEGQLQLAHDLTTRLPNTFAALQSGRIDLSKARALVEVTGPLSIEDARTVEAKVLPKAGERTLTQLRASARYHRDRVDPECAERRRHQATAERTAWFHPLDDGSGMLCLRGPGERTYQAWLVIDAAARKIKAGGDERTLEAIRHDLALDLLLGKHDDTRVRVQVYLHVPATTLAGITDDPGILSGYGPVTAAACRELAARDATWRRVFTDPVTGTVKDVDRRTYRPPAALAEYIQVRDGTCVAPGCTRTAHACQLDHSIAWVDAGCTCEDNLGPLCWTHHRLKTLCGWQLHQPHPGHFVWHSPVGQRHQTLPGSILNPQ